MACRILIVEDEFILAKNLQNFAETLGHTVVSITDDGAKAIEASDRLRPDLVLMDIKLNGLDGISASRYIAGEKKIPIIMITAYSDHQFIESAADEGVMTYLIKPVSMSDLQAAIDITLARNREMQELRRQVDELQLSLAHRKIIDRAKGYLMDNLHLSEADAYHRLQQQSQRENRTMADIAQSVITTFSLGE
ncbi:MAG: response regulator [bacterium]